MHTCCCCMQCRRSYDTNLHLLLNNCRHHTAGLLALLAGVREG